MFDSVSLRASDQGVQHQKESWCTFKNRSLSDNSECAAKNWLTIFLFDMIGITKNSERCEIFKMQPAHQSVQYLEFICVHCTFYCAVE